MTGIKHQDHQTFAIVLCSCSFSLLCTGLSKSAGKRDRKYQQKISFVILSAFLLISPLLSRLNWKDIDHPRNYCQNITLTLVPGITEWEGDVLLGVKIQSPEKMRVKQDSSIGLWHRPGCEDTWVLGPAFWKRNVFLWTSIWASLQMINDKACLFRKLTQPGRQGLVSSRDAWFL